MIDEAQNELFEELDLYNWVQRQVLGEEPSDEEKIVTASVRLNQPLVDYADALAGNLGVSRQKVLKKAIEIGLQMTHETYSQWMKDHQPKKKRRASK